MSGFKAPPADGSAIVGDDSDYMHPGDAFLLNNPYNGGTHLPDCTVVNPVFEGERIVFFVASRGHHPDIGGRTPGSMPPDSTHVDEEGVLIDPFRLVDRGTFREQPFRELLGSAKYPARQPNQNVADMQAQLAANVRGVTEVRNMIAQYGLDTVLAYMGHVQDNAEESVRQAISVLSDGSFVCEMDSGLHVNVNITVNTEERHAVVDFTGTSEQGAHNFNAPGRPFREQLSSMSSVHSFLMTFL